MTAPPVSLSSHVAAARLTIDLDALAANYRLLRERGGKAVAGAAIKADAYGLGAVPVARKLVKEGCRDFFVAHLGEAQELRAAGGVLRSVNLYVLNGPNGGRPEAFLDARAWPVLNTAGDIALWSGFAKLQKVRLPAMLHFDTGMNRLGLTPREADDLHAEDKRLAVLDLHGVMSHMACADDPENPFNAEQLKRFRAIVARFPGTRTSLANSAAIFLGGDYHFDLTRPGIGLYGGNPFCKGANPMTAVATLEAPIIQVREVAPGETVGYGRTHRAERRLRIATLPVGYADGYLRAIGNHGAVWAAGKRHKVVGRVSMDLITVDISSARRGVLGPGDYVELIGPHMSVDEVAQSGGTFSYEMLTNLGRRYARRYTGTAPDGGTAPMARPGGGGQT